MCDVGYGPLTREATSIDVQYGVMDGMAVDGVLDGCLELLDARRRIDGKDAHL